MSITIIIYNFCIYYITFQSCKLACLSLPPQSNVCKQGQSQPEWTPLQESALKVGSLPYLQISDQVGVGCNGQRFSLRQHSVSNHRKKFYGLGPRCHKQKIVFNELKYFGHYYYYLSICAPLYQCYKTFFFIMNPWANISQSVCLWLAFSANIYK